MPQLTGIARRSGNWQEVSTYFSCVFPVDFEPDASLVRDVRLIMPDFVPVWMRRTYATPEGNEAHIDFVCAGRWTHTIDEPDHTPLTVERPSNFPFKGGYVYHQRTFSTRMFGIEVPEEWKARGIDDLPLPFDRKLADWIRATHHSFLNKSEKEAKQDAKQLIVDEEKAQQKALDKINENAGAEWDDKAGSPGMHRDAEWEMTRGESVSVST